MTTRHDASNGTCDEPGLPATKTYDGMTAEEALAAVGTTADGLASEEAARRRATWGANEVVGKRTNPIVAFFKRYWGPMPWLLEIAMVLALAIGHTTEALVIFVLLTVNAVIGQVQSASANHAVELLRRDTVVEVRCRRDDAWADVPSRELVPGDVVTFALGNIVSADAVVLTGEAELDCSALTGESLPQHVARGDVAPSGAVVCRGTVEAVVVNTGAHTVWGQTVALVDEAHPRSHQQELLFTIVRLMMYVGVVASALVAIWALAHGHGLVEVASLVVTFLMGAVPVALPAVLAIVQAAGALALSHQGVLVTRLDSVEDAASVDVFCFDKTGTLTENRLEVTEVHPLGDATAEGVVRAAALASETAGVAAIDAACLRRAEADGVSLDSARQVSYTPFEPATKRTEALVERADGTELSIIKGAPRTILALCSPTEQVGAAAQNVVEGLSRRGLRAIAVAAGAPGATPTCLGILGLSDPPRADAHDLVRRLGELGIRCLMITGDDTAIAREVGRATGIGGDIAPAPRLRQGTDADKLALVEASDGFGEVLPQDKHTIVEVLQRAGHTVGMTGDGVNDAPALKQAELGCAVAGATDVARASASAVLTEPGLRGIVSAVTESRKAYQRMLTWVINKVTKVIEVVVLFTLGYVLTGSMPVTLLGMSLLIFANDFATMSIATDNVTATDSPNAWRLRPIVIAASILGTLFALEDLAIAWAGDAVFGLGADATATLVMYALVVNSQVRILTVRERNHFWSSCPSAGMGIVAIACIVGFTALVLVDAIVPAVSLPAVAGTLAACLVGGVVIDLVKYAVFRLLGVGVAQRR